MDSFTLWVKGVNHCNTMSFRRLSAAQLAFLGSSVARPRNLATSVESRESQGKDAQSGVASRINEELQNGYQSGAYMQLTKPDPDLLTGAPEFKGLSLPIQVLSVSAAQSAWTHSFRIM